MTTTRQALSTLLLAAACVGVVLASCQGDVGSVCQPGLTACDGECVNLLTDNRYCSPTSACGAECAAGHVCDGSGVCALTCQPGLTACDGECVNLLTDNRYCSPTSACGTECAAGHVCLQGQCHPIDCSDLLEPNEGSATASPFSGTSALTNLRLCPGDFDFFQTDAAVGTTMSIEVRRSSPWATITVYHLPASGEIPDALRTVTGGAEDTSFIIDLGGLPTGTNFFAVTASGVPPWGEPYDLLVQVGP